VRINGRVVTDLGTKVEEQRDKVSVNGKPVGGRERHVYFVLNKPWASSPRSTTRRGGTRCGS
jgi:23S rRNA pseudouridine2605 synthase